MEQNSILFRRRCATRYSLLRLPLDHIQNSWVHWKGKEKHGKIIYGAIGIGDFKMKVHHASVARLFEQNDLILDAEAVYATAKELLA